MVEKCNLLKKILNFVYYRYKKIGRGRAQAQAQAHVAS